MHLCLGLRTSVNMEEEQQIPSSLSSSERETLSDSLGGGLQSSRKQLTSMSTCDVATHHGDWRTPKNVAKLAVLCAVIAAVWIMLAIPTVMFYTPQVSLRVLIVTSCA